MGESCSSADRAPRTKTEVLSSRLYHRQYMHFVFYRIGKAGEEKYRRISTYWFPDWWIACNSLCRRGDHPSVVLAHTSINNRDITIGARGCRYGVSQQVFPACAQGNNAMSNSGGFENLYRMILLFVSRLARARCCGWASVPWRHCIAFFR